MPHVGNTDQMIRKNLDELIEESTRLAETADEHSVFDYRQYEELIVKSCGLIQFLLGDSETSREYQDRVKRRSGLGQVSGSPRWYFTAVWIHRIVAVLRGIRNNYLAGMYEELMDRMVADISADYMAQAEQLFEEGTNAQLGYVAAAATCGALLEDAIRRLCDRQSPQIPTTKPNGEYKKLTAMVDELEECECLQRSKARSIAILGED